MKNSERIAWRVMVFGPLGLIALTVPCLVALSQLSARTSQAFTPRAWQEPLRSAERALAEGDLGGAARAERAAYRAALRSGQWSGMIEVGDLRLRMQAGVDLRDPTARAEV